MSKQIAVNIQRYGDFDVLQTVATLLSPENMEKSEAKNIVAITITSNLNTDNPDYAIKELKSHGFTVINSVSCTVGGNL